MAKQTAQLRYLRIAPRKVRRVADVVKGLSVIEAEAQLLLQRQRPAQALLKLLRSAVANAESSKKIDKSKLIIESFRVDGGPMLKRSLPRARGSASPIQKKMSHVTIILAENPQAPSARFKIMVVKKVKKPEDAKPRKRKEGNVPEGKEKEKEKPEKERDTQRDNPGFFRRAFRRKSI